jgi:peptidyl-prolyl cis-trans isomerase SurA
MPKIHTILIATFLCLFASPHFSSAEIVDRIVAEVNGNVITLSELNEYGKPFYQSIMAKAPADVVEAEIQKIRSELLDRLIEDKLIEQEAAKFNISISESEVDSTIANIIQENNISPAQFKQELTKMGTNEESYRANIKNQMLKSRMINIEIRSKLVITNERI